MAKRFPAAFHLERFLLIVLLANLALAQPLYDLVGKQAEFLVAQRMNAGDLFTFALLLSIFIPGALAFLPVLAGRVHARLESGVFFLLFGVLAALTLAPVLIALGWQGAQALSAILFLSVLVLVLYVRLAAVRLFFKVLSPAVLIFPLFFLFFSRATAIVLPGGAEPASGPVSQRNSADIVFLVLDEFPLVSLLTRELEIDRERFPNFARLADQANWYRAASTGSETTVGAVPSILTGLDPVPQSDRLPIAANYPRNLFSLLQDRYAMVASETATRLCAGARCSAQSPYLPRRIKTSSLISDLSLIYLHIVTPAPYAGKLPSVSNAWSGFSTEENALDTAQREPGGLEKARALAELSANVSWNSRSSEVEQFIAAVVASEQPQLYYLHTLLPHAIWRYLPDGRQYMIAERWEAMRTVSKSGQQDVWQDDPFAVRQQWQRHLLQVRYVDTLLGKLLDRLAANGMLDSSLLVVTGDHGTSFIAGQPRRTINTETLSDINAIPLFIKFPGQQQGQVSDRPATLADILPTLVDALGIKINWQFDGVSLLADRQDRTMVRTVTARGEGFEYPVEQQRQHLQNRARVQARVFGAGREQRFFALGPQPELIGTVPADLPMTASSRGLVRLEGEQLYRNVSPGSSFVPRLVRGTIFGLPAPAVPRELAIAVNGVIRATSRTLDIPGYRDSFSALLPEGALRAGVNTVRAYLIEENGAGILLTELGADSAPDWTLASENGLESITSKEWGVFMVLPQTLAGDLRSFEAETGSLINLAGTVPGPEEKDLMVLTFLDDAFAGMALATENAFSIPVFPPGRKPAAATTARVFVLDPGHRTARELDDPPRCDPAWLFASPLSWQGADCGGVAATPLEPVGDGFEASLDFGEASTLPFMVSGWEMEESGISWTLGLSATLEIPLRAGLREMSVTARIKPFLHAPEHSSQALWIMANGRAVYSSTLEQVKFTDISWNIAQDILSLDNEKLTLTWLLPDAVSPQAIGAGDDLRALGLAVLRLDIKAE